MNDSDMPDPDAARAVLKVSGADAYRFLQDLVTNDLRRLDAGLVYAALLTPQGKLIVDFFLLRAAGDGGDAILIDVPESEADALEKRLTLYKLRAKVDIERLDMPVSRGTGPAPEGALADPRVPALGWRGYGLGESDDTDWTALHVANAVPRWGFELGPESYILEMGFERLNGVDFKKGCYVGQEVTARMKHKTALRKGLAKVTVDGAAPVGTEITVDGKPVGTLYSQSGGEGLAYLRFDRAGPDMQAGAARLSFEPGLQL